ncbi:Carbamoyltransferase HypF [archaeon HR05]|nr:Carbamoyltransferase HypF [archaeon HR05]
MHVRYTITIHGRVQGIGFRPFVYRLAIANNLRGYVRNMGDGSVEIVVDGNEHDLERFIDALKHDKPPLALYEFMDIEKSEGGSEEFANFSIFGSVDTPSTVEPSIPPDIAICDECLHELFNMHDRRYLYFFITCTNCGPRFTMVRALPYDRVNTSMAEFPLCNECLKEYKDPLNRRFHNESIACHECGPRLYLVDCKGRRVDAAVVNDDNSDDGNPIATASRLIEQGCIIAVKGIGGFHLITSAYDDDAISRLRKGKRRESKPLAVMARNIDAVREFAVMDEVEESILRSYARPIVLLRKGSNYNLSPLVSNLDTVGVMLPYTALHHLIFNMLNLNALVVTSANVSDEPIIADDDEALRLGFVDYLLIHNRRIINPCDDSVVIVNSCSPMIVRRARGYVPSPISIDVYSSRCILALGAHLNVTISILFKDKIVASQHLGDMDSLKAYTNLCNTVERFCRMLNVRPDVVVCDLHPSIPTTNLAYTIAREYGCSLKRVQHHHAHASTLLIEDKKVNMVREGRRGMVCIVCDGNGYGYDGNVWGGEVFLIDGSKYERVAHLMEQPMIGGDLAAYYPLRMVAGILYSSSVDGVEDYLYSRSYTLPYGRAEMDAILDVARKGRYIIKTTSTGRILDAISFLLGVADRRGYEGEPAMLFESVAYGGDDVLKLEPRIINCTLDTKYLIEEIFCSMKRFHTRDLAYSAHVYMAKGLATLALDNAMRHGIDTIGISGGVTYNRIITPLIKRYVEEHGLRFIHNSIIPAGDAGLSIGQAYHACINDTSLSNN